jgi:hypothetical protein
MPTTQHWARVPPAKAGKHPGPPSSWTRVLPEHAARVPNLPDRCWLDVPGKVRAVAKYLLEFTEDPQRGASQATCQDATNQ